MYRKWPESAVGKMVRKTECVFRVALAPCPLSFGHSRLHGSRPTTEACAPRFLITGWRLPRGSVKLGSWIALWTWTGASELGSNLCSYERDAGPELGAASAFRTERSSSAVGPRASLGQGHERLCLNCRTCEMVLAPPSLRVVVRIQREVFAPTWVLGLGGVMTSSGRSRAGNLEPIIGATALGHSSLSLGFFIHKMRKMNSCWFCHRQLFWGISETVIMVQFMFYI